jgi:hypothetical protein
MSANIVTPDVVPYGNGLVRYLNEATSKIGANFLRSGIALDLAGATPPRAQFVGVVKYEPAWAISHPVQNWGIPAYSKFTSITKGIVGYKFSKKSGQSDNDYLAFLKGDTTKRTAIDSFANWMTALSTAPVGSVLSLCFDLNTGFPRVMVGGPNRTTVNPGLGFVLVGQGIVIEPENEMIGFDLDANIVYGSA